MAGYSSANSGFSTLILQIPVAQLQTHCPCQLQVDQGRVGNSELNSAGLWKEKLN